MPKEDIHKRSLTKSSQDPDYEVIEFGQQYCNAPPLPEKTGNREFY